MLNIQKEMLVCPITRQIFLDPVTCGDGWIYEQKAIKKWLKKNDTSPMTNEIISNKILNPCQPVRNMVLQYLGQYPDEKNNQYTSSNNHSDKIDKINSYIREGNYEKLLKYKNFSLKLFFSEKNSEVSRKKNIFVQILRSGNTNIILHVINNLIDHDYRNSNGWMMVHYICKYGPYEIIDLLIDKCDLEAETKSGWKPIHLLCNHGTYDAIKYLIDQNVDLNATVGYKENNEIIIYGVTHLIIINRDINPIEKSELIEYIIRKKILSESD